MPPRIRLDSTPVPSPLLTPAFEGSKGVPIETLDLSKPISELLRVGTKRAHEEVENSEGAARLVQGEVSRQEYARWVIGLWCVYDALERALEASSTNPVLAPTYRPALLARTPALSADIACLLSTPDWQAHPAYTSVISNPPLALVQYTARVETLAAEEPERLLAHAYVRYLGDLSGGQVIKRRLAKSLELEDAGLEFFEFTKLEGGKDKAAVGDMRKIKEWYRRGMDEGVGDNADLKAALVDEANEAFRLNAGLFATIPARPAPQPSLVAWDASPKTDVQTDEPSSEWTLSVSTLIPFLVSIGLAHFLLVTMGFTGQAGWDKFLVVVKWLESKIGMSV